MNLKKQVIFYELPDLQTLNLEYCLVKTILKSLNRHVDLKGHARLSRVAFDIGLNMRTIYRHIDSYCIHIQPKTNRYYIMDDSPLFKRMGYISFERK